MSSGHLATIPCRDAPVNGLTGGGEGNGAKQAAFTGIVKLQQGGIQLRTVSLTAFYSGQSGFSTGGEWSAEQLTRAEARERVLIMSKDGQTRATADGATFDVIANTVLWETTSPSRVVKTWHKVRGSRSI